MPLLPGVDFSLAGEFTDRFTLTNTDITNRYVILSHTPTSALSTTLTVIGGISQDYTVDYVVIGNMLTWSGLGLDGLLSSGDELLAQYK